MIYKSGVSAADFHQDTQLFFKGKKVAVTGGSGFIGSHVVEQLLELGALPVVLTRKAAPEFLGNVLESIVLKQCDLNDYDETRKAFDGCSVVLNMAASVAGIEYNKNHPATIFQDNMQTFFNAIKAAKEVGTERFLVTSSACVYPRHCSIPTPEEEGFVDEPEPTNSGYGWSKRMEEYLGKKYAEEYGMSISIARPYNAYGPRDNFLPQSSHVIPALILKAFKSKDGLLPVWGDGTHSRSFLYVDDFARGCLEVAARFPKAEALNIGAEEEITIRDTALLVAKYVGEVRGQKIEPVFQSHGITGQPRRKCDSSKARMNLGFEAQVRFEDGLIKTVQWFQEYLRENSSLFTG